MTFAVISLLVDAPSPRAKDETDLSIATSH
jgi:hypothetical protein